MGGVTMLIDPDVDGCDIWHNNYITRLKGSPDEVCHEIFKRSTYSTVIKGEIKCFQEFNISLDITGIGLVYMDILERMGLKINYIKFREPNTAIPVLNPECRSINYINNVDVRRIDLI
jgi:hypothetical protein